jgi:hypothetical protein
VKAGRPIAVVLTSHWLSLAGTIVVTTAGLLWLFALPVHARGHVDNPYTGILLFLILPALFFAGLAMIPIGALLSKRRIAAGLSGAPIDRAAALRRLALFLGVTTVANVVIGSQLTYRAVEHMETAQFCGQSCHVMTPQFRAHAVAPHSRIECVSCHVSPGATGWVRSKMDGTRQLVEVAMQSFPRPIPSGLASGRLVGSAETCEHCHEHSATSPIRVRAIPTHADDEAGTLTWTVLSMRVGGGALGGIHGAHLADGVVIRYASADPARQTIPWVEVSRPNGGPVTTYFAQGASAATVAGLPVYTMQCADCHNRPAHTFERPERAVDLAMVTGRLPATLPFMKKNGVALLRKSYVDDNDARTQLAQELRRLYPERPASEIDPAAAELATIWSRNVFPDLKVTWGTYANNLGHSDAEPGCFRCHDGSHATADGSASLDQDCSTCHEPIAVDEPHPAVLDTLGISALLKRSGS